MTFFNLINYLSFLSHSLNLCSRNTEPSEKDDAFKEVIASCQSLNSLETNSLKSNLPQVNIFLKMKFDTHVAA